MSGQALYKADPGTPGLELAIALSIVVVGVENILGRGTGHRWMLAGLFGLVHGLGFYSVLNDLDLAGAGLLTTLAAFNIGVETGQLVIVAILFPPLIWWSRRAWYGTSVKALSFMIVLLAGWWTLERAGLV